MKTNDIKKGMRVILENGWEADVDDNLKGNTRVLKVYGIFTDTGSVYSHDIKYVIVNGKCVEVEHTPAQLKLKKMVEVLMG